MGASTMPSALPSPEPASVASLGPDAWLAFTDGWAHAGGKEVFGNEQWLARLEQAYGPMLSAAPPRWDADELERFNKHFVGGSCDRFLPAEGDGCFGPFWPRRDCPIGHRLHLPVAGDCGEMAIAAPEVQLWPDKANCSTEGTLERAEDWLCGGPGAKLCERLHVERQCATPPALKRATLNRLFDEYYNATAPLPRPTPPPSGAGPRARLGRALRPLAILLGSLAELHPFQDANSRARLLVLQSELARLGDHGVFLYDASWSVYPLLHSLPLIEVFVLQGWCGWEAYLHTRTSPFANVSGAMPLGALDGARTEIAAINGSARVEAARAVAATLYDAEADACALPAANAPPESAAPVPPRTPPSLSPALPPLPPPPPPPPMSPAPQPAAREWGLSAAALVPPDGPGTVVADASAARSQRN